MRTTRGRCKGACEEPAPRNSASPSRGRPPTDRAAADHPLGLVDGLIDLNERHRTNYPALFTAGIHSAKAVPTLPRFALPSHETPSQRRWCKIPCFGLWL